MSILSWLSEKPQWNFRLLQLLLQDKTESPRNLNFTQIIQKSDNFPITFPTDNTRCKFIRNVESQTFEQYFNSACILLHEKSLFLCAKFLVFKQQFGSEAEKKFYENLSLVKFLQRLIEKRAVYFDYNNEEFLLINNYSSFGRWTLIGSDQQTTKLNLNNCLSYDELKLAAHFSVSSYSYFINDGNMNNNGLFAQIRSTIQLEGVIIGIGHIQLNKAKTMDYQEIVITKDQNKDGYGYPVIPTIHTIFSDFYNEHCWTYDRVQGKNTDALVEIEGNSFFNNNTYSKRVALIIDVLLREANRRAEEKCCFAYVHIGDFKTGNCHTKSHQNQLIFDVLLERLQSLGVKISKITNINICEMNQDEKLKWKSFINIEGHPKQGVHIDFNKRNPFSSLQSKDENKLLVVSYGWNGNSLPGNKFWKSEFLTDEAIIAASSQIVEIQNPHINPKISVGNLKIITPESIIDFEQYRNRMEQIITDGIF